MIAAAALSLLLQAAAPSAAPPAPAQAAPAGEGIATLFLFFRLRYYHDVVVEHPCRRADPDRMRALDERYDALHRELVAPRTGGPPRSEPDPGCGMGVIFFGYDNALNEMERHLRGAGL
ncbi:MAG TPA: hypothetical protein VGO55_14400 [Allosphingosinicella sp.]|jgi:hypothetical protein|nr:hypothetical protein [Allosphingosinicella sp.]